MSSRRRRFATVGCTDKSLQSNTLCLSLRVVGYHLIDQSTGKYCPTSPFHGFSPFPRDLPLNCFQRYHVTASMGLNVI